MPAGTTWRTRRLVPWVAVLCGACAQTHGAARGSSAATDGSVGNSARDPLYAETDSAVPSSTLDTSDMASASDPVGPGGLAVTARHHLHRARLGTCPNNLAPDAATPELPPAPEADGGVVPRPDFIRDECSHDADCSAHAYGQCVVALVPSGPLPSVAYLACQYGCVADGDCGADELCLCGTTIGRCVRASCHTDADCPGAACSLFERGDGCGRYETYFKCALPGRECVDDSQCEPAFRCTGTTCSPRSEC